MGEEILDKVKRWTGLPVGAGFGPTKTLAKLANHLAKRAKGATGVHVLDSVDRITTALGNTELANIWGISSGFIRRLSTLGIATPLQLRDANPFAVRRAMSIRPPDDPKPDVPPADDPNRREILLVGDMALGLFKDCRITCIDMGSGERKNNIAAGLDILTGFWVGLSGCLGRKGVLTMPPRS